MISDLQQLSTRIPDLRNFGACCRRRVSTAGRMVSLPKQASRPLFLNTGCAARVFGLVAPRSLKIVYIAWMSLAFTMGLLASAVVLTIFYFPVIGDRDADGSRRHTR